MIGSPAGQGLSAAGPDRGAGVVATILASWLITVFVAVSVVTTTEILFPVLRGRKHRLASNASR
jgi:hypothetical protein